MSPPVLPEYIWQLRPKSEQGAAPERYTLLRILLLSAYEAESHRYWRLRLQEIFADAQWTCLILPPRHFNWRIRGNGLTWSQSESSRLTMPYDVCIATSMVDLATLRGLVPALARIPTVLYFHENQFAYPLSDVSKASSPKAAQAAAQKQLIEPQMVQLYAALCADVVCFNSCHNRDSFARGVADLLAKMPDEVPPGIVPRLLAKQVILPVPLADELFDANGLFDTNEFFDTKVAKIPRGRAGKDSVVDTQANDQRRNEHQSKYGNTERTVIVWNHRWEYDKGPERLLGFIKALPPSLNLTFHIIGQSFRKVPPSFTEIEACLRERTWLGRWGYVADREGYLAALAEADIVISTALHDFQGLSVLEAIALGCIPLLPNRLSYPEFVGSKFLYPSYEDAADEALSMGAAFERLLAAAPLYAAELDGVNVRSLSRASLSPSYRDLIAGLV